MRRVFAIFIMLTILCGCTQTNMSMDQALALREAVLNGKGCAFSVLLTADYQDIYYTFGMNCNSDSEGNITFEITEPESIKGITGVISSDGGKLTFDDQALLFSTIAEGQITPVSAPWVFLMSLRSGYIEGCAQEENGLLLRLNDTYADNALRLNIQINENVPVFAEIIWQERRVVTMNVEGFCIL